MDFRVQFVKHFALTKLFLANQCHLDVALQKRRQTMAGITLAWANER